MIKLTKTALTLVVALQSSFTFAANSLPTPTVEYSADQTMETSEMVMSGKVYVTPTKERREMDMNGENMINIIRKDKNMILNLMPSQQMYMEMKMDMAATQQQGPSLEGYKYEMTPMGSETINGVQADKNKVIMTDKDGRKMGGFMWTTKDGIMVKVDVIAVEKGNKMRMKQELTNIKIGKQPASLFEIPAGYSKMGAGMPNMQDIQNMMKSNEEPAPAEQKPAKKSGGFNFNDALKMIR